jgi:ribose transport system substrate-binding protein
MRLSHLGGFRPFNLLLCLLLPAALWGCTGGGGGGADGGSAGSSGSASKRIIILTNGSSPFWDAAAAGAKDGAKDLQLEAAGYRVVVDRNDFKAEGQIDKLKQYAGSSDVVAVGISVTDAGNQAIVQEMRKLREAGIKVITIDSDVDRETSEDARFAYLGTDNIVAGRELGRAAQGLLPGGGKYATFVGLKGATNAIERIAGFGEGAGNRFQQAENLGDGGDEIVARSNVRDALDRHSDLKALVGIWSYNTPAIVDIVAQLGVREKVKVVGFDADPPAIAGMQKGQVDVMVVQNPYQMGYQGVRLLKALLEDDQTAIQDMFPDYGQPAGDRYDTGLKVIVPDENSPLRGDMFDENTEFLTLKEFQAWLQQYGLTGS